MVKRDIYPWPKSEYAETRGRTVADINIEVKGPTVELLTWTLADGFLALYDTLDRDRSCV